MKPKKNPNKDLNRNRSLFFITGLMLTLALTYTALEWKTYDNPMNYKQAFNDLDPIMEEEPPLVLMTPPPPPPPPIAPVEIDIVDDDDPVKETVIETTEVDDEIPILEVNDIPETIDEIADEIPFIAIENVPIFPGCEDEKNKRACFQNMMQKHIKKHFRYPEIAIDMNIQGRVSTTFIIQKDGTIGGVRMRGPDKNLEKEAARILSKLPKMTPGKQRGQAVRVPFSIPITFKLQ